MSDQDFTAELTAGDDLVETIISSIPDGADMATTVQFIMMDLVAILVQDFGHTPEDIAATISAVLKDMTTVIH